MKEETKVSENEDTSDNEEETKTETGDENEGNEEEVEDTEDSKEEITEEQKYLLKALLDPKTSINTLKMIAQQMGLEVSPAVKQTKTEVQKTIIDELSEELGDDWSYLAPKLGKVFQNRLENLTQTFENRFRKFEEKSATQSFEQAERQFFKDNPDAKRVFGKMRELATRYGPPEGIDPIEYIQDLYNLASTKGKSLAQTVEGQRKVRMKKSKQQQGLEGRTSTQDTNENVVKQAKSIREAVEAAVKKLGKFEG